MDTRDQLILDATLKARKLAADLERDAKAMASADPEGQRLTNAALTSAHALVTALNQASNERK